jgi:hypothetical protein
VKERRVFWARDVVEGYPSVSPVHDICHSSGSAEGSQLLIIHIREESEAMLEQVARHCVRQMVVVRTGGHRRGSKGERIVAQREKRTAELTPSRLRVKLSRNHRRLYVTGSKD